jgi:hypothetical protein
MDFGTRVDKLIGDGSGEFDGFHPFSVAQSTGGLAESFDHQNWVSLPHNFAFDEVRCIPGHGATAPLTQILATFLA